MRKRGVARAAVGVAAMAATMGLTGAPASAASVAGNCAEDGYEAWGVAYYSVSGGYTYWDRFALEQLYAGPKTTAFVRIKHSVSGVDPIAWGPSQVHDLRSDTPKNHDPAGTRRTPNARATYTEFTFRFDESGFDDECIASTPSV